MYSFPEFIPIKKSIFLIMFFSSPFLPFPLKPNNNNKTDLFK